MLVIASNAPIRFRKQIEGLRLLVTPFAQQGHETDGSGEAGFGAVPASALRRDHPY
jgi:hypothetical protein